MCIANPGGKDNGKEGYRYVAVSKGERQEIKERWVRDRKRENEDKVKEEPGKVSRVNQGKERDKKKYGAPSSALLSLDNTERHLATCCK